MVMPASSVREARENATTCQRAGPRDSKPRSARRHARRLVLHDRLSDHHWWTRGYRCVHVALGAKRATCLTQWRPRRGSACRNGPVPFPGQSAGKAGHKPLRSTHALPAGRAIFLIARFSAVRCGSTCIRLPLSPLQYAGRRRLPSHLSTPAAAFTSMRKRHVALFLARALADGGQRLSARERPRRLTLSTNTVCAHHSSHALHAGMARNLRGIGCDVRASARVLAVRITVASKTVFCVSDQEGRWGGCQAVVCGTDAMI